MIVKRSGGMTEFIPSPSEKRDGVIRNHVLDLLANLDERVRRIEEAVGLPVDLSDEFTTAMTRITREEAHVQRLNEALLDAGIDQGETIPG
ncbi:MAG: VrlD [Armatimonadetes bacterium]|nr:VrlD [Armatimonadota bacterium]